MRHSQFEFRQGIGANEESRFLELASFGRTSKKETHKKAGRKKESRRRG